VARKKILFISFIFLTTVLIEFGPAQQEPPSPPEGDEPNQTEQPPTRKEPAPTPRTTPSPTPPQRRQAPSPASGADMVSLNFNRADLVEVVHVLAQHLKLTYTIDPEVKGTVTIHSAEPVKRADLFPIFHQILRMNGAVAVKTGNLYRISPIKDAKGLARPPTQGKEDSLALQVVPIRFFSVTEMKKLLTPFLTPGGEILDYPRGNFLIIVDLPSNIQRLIEIRDLIDVNVFAGTRMEIYQPKVASAEELAAEMTKIMQGYASSAAQAEGFTAQFIPIPRINQLLVISYSEAAWTYAKRWLDRIDVVAEGPGRRIFIYPVENGKAAELADILNQALGQPSTARRDTPRTLQDLHRSTPPIQGLPGTSRSPFGGSTTTSPGSSMFGAQPPPLGAYAVAPAPQPAPPAAPAAPPPGVGVPPPTPPPTAPGARPAPQPQEQLRIVADPATNSLIIYGTAQEFQNIKNILKDLDIIPRQVLLDVMVVEVTLADDQSLGIEYEILGRNRPGIFGQTFGSGGAIRSGTLPAPPSGGAITQFGSGISGIIGSNDLRVFINAVMTDSRAKVLSSPTVLATDNRPARIQVGTEEPVPTGTITQAVGTLAETTTVQYRNTGRIVTIIPQVNSLGLVNLQILTEVSQRGANVLVGPNSFPSFDTRQAETTGVVQDGETLVIGGIIAENKSKERTGIPYLMDIPVFGRFFGTTTDSVRRTELIMLVTPRVIRNVREARDTTEEFKRRVFTAGRELERIRREDEAQKKEEFKKEKEEKEPVAPNPSSYAPEKEPRKVPQKEVSLKEDSNSAPYETRVTIQESSQGVGPMNIPEPQIQEAGPAIKEEKAPRIAAKVKTPAEGGPWAVQVKSDPDERTSSNLAKKLIDRGYDAYIVKTTVNGQTWHRVRVGRFASLKEAKELQAILKSNEGFSEAFAVMR
jgi:general secretion pathway protein D